MKTVINSCLIGGVIGGIVLFIATQNDLNPDYAMMIPIGIFAGSFWGCIVGLIINNRRESSKKDNNSIKEGSITPKNLAIRSDGYYLGSIEISDGNLFFIMFFTSKGYVAYQELSERVFYGLKDEEIRQTIAEGEEMNEMEVSSNLTKYKRNGNDITMKFYDPDEEGNLDPLDKVPYEEPNIYYQFFGKISKNEMILDMVAGVFNMGIKDYTTQIFFKNVKFQFIPIK